MAKEIELRRHTDDEDDQLTSEGIEAAVDIGQGLRGGYQMVASSGARRAIQTAACLLAGMGEVVPGGVRVEPGLRSDREDDWKSAYARVGKGDLESLRDADADLVSEDSARLAGCLRRLFDQIEDGERVLAIGHSPTSAAAVLGLTGEVIAPLRKGAGVVVAEADGRHEVVIRLEA